MRNGKVRMGKEEVTRFEALDELKKRLGKKGFEAEMRKRFKRNLNKLKEI